MSKKIPFPIRGEPKLKQAIEDIADEEGHTFSGMARKILTDGVKAYKKI